MPQISADLFKDGVAEVAEPARQRASFEEQSEHLNREFSSTGVKDAA
jgi:hypothetical protein